MYTRYLLATILAVLASGSCGAGTSNSGLRYELDIATGVSPAPRASVARRTSAAAVIADAADEIFWDAFELCGDGVVDSASEQCDRLDLQGNTCISLSYGGGTLTCDRTCHFDTSQCSGTCLLPCVTDNDCGVCGICFTNICVP